WGSRVMQLLPRAKSSEEGTYQTERVNAVLKTIDNKQLLGLLTTSIKNLQSRYGDWKIQWGEINRYQRPANGVFDDNAPSIAVGQVSSVYGELPSFVSRNMNNTKKRYGYSGNSFIAAVEFGPTLKAKSIMTGGQSTDPQSKHFTDQADGYINGKFKDVLFYKADVLKHAEKTYHPGG
ncbi:MAG TPA: penicillin acylase family protein, partial [Mucilaginibacter sp.]